MYKRPLFIFFIGLSLMPLLSVGQKADDDYVTNAKYFLNRGDDSTRCPFLLAENLDTSDFLYIKRALSTDSICRRITYDHGATVVTECLTFNKKERGIIDSFLSNYENFAWKDNSLVNKSTIITRKTIDSLAVNNIQLVNYLSKDYHFSSVEFMSKPIFLRDYTICIFYSQSIFRVFGGGGSFTIFQKVNGKWKIYRWL